MPAAIRPAELKRIGVLTGGGDCPGLNAVIRAVTKDALHHGIEVVGIEDGFRGLIEPDRSRPLRYDDVSDILTRGGTILGSANDVDPTRYVVGTNPDGSPVYEDVIDTCLANAGQLSLDALVTIGGDGTQTIAAEIHERGLACIGVPKTIDNDVVGTDITFGFLTAASIATEALDRVHTTAESHHRALVVEVMGRDSGWIALHAGVAAGADVILIPEIPFSYDAIAEAIEERRRRGKHFTIICLAEGAKPEDSAPEAPPEGAHNVASQTAVRTGVDARAVILGHVQRGGTPVAADRVLATLFGDHAIEMAKQGQTGRMAAVQNGRLVEVPLAEVASGRRRVPADHPLIAAARSVYTSFAEHG